VHLRVIQDAWGSAADDRAGPGSAAVRIAENLDRADPDRRLARTRSVHRPPLAALLAVMCACAHPVPAPPPAAAPAPDRGVDIAAARARGAAQRFTWEPWSPAAFARAAREHRFILVDGAAAWCHWCHVMDETTYRDAEVGEALRAHFVAIRVDIDERPDLAERYGDWGWPATILLSPDAEELGKFRGYLPAERLREILAETVTGTAAAEASAPAIAPPPRGEALPWIAARAIRDLDRFYDEEHGGWGFRVKAPVGDNAVFELRRAAHGDARAAARVAQTLDRQRAIVDAARQQRVAGRELAGVDPDQLVPGEPAHEQLVVKAGAEAAGLYEVNAWQRGAVGHPRSFPSREDAGASASVGDLATPRRDTSPEARPRPTRWCARAVRRRASRRCGSPRRIAGRYGRGSSGRGARSRGDTPRRSRAGAAGP